MMTISRRQFAKLSALAGVGAMLQSPLSLASKQPGHSGLWIDACGGVLDGDPLTPDIMLQIKASKMSCVFQTVGAVGNPSESETLLSIVQGIADMQTQVDQQPEAFKFIRRIEDIQQAKQEQRIGIGLALQDGVAFQSDLEVLNTLNGLGLRIIQPTYNIRNKLGDGCMVPENLGLSDQGFKAVEKLNELNILLDLSHCGVNTTRDGIAHSKKPMAFTHTGCSAIYNHPRNKTDQQIRALANKGGVIGIYIMPYLGPNGQPTAKDLITHLEHAINIAGEDHVGLGTDGRVLPTELTDEYKKWFAEMTAERIKSGIGPKNENPTAYLFANELNMPNRYGALADMLSKRGHSATRIEKILGANFARLFSEVW
jgi:membrane dipeptidase